jgi:phosphatidylserine/phosphatidylglycerophosphate/cardiolipin synthase-like enzyme
MEPIQVYFTSACTFVVDGQPSALDALVQAVADAQQQVDIAIYNISYTPLVDALIDAHQRGIEVRLVMEADNRSRSGPERLIKAGIPIQTDSPRGLMHNKFVVIDNSEVWSGSMNFTTSGDQQDANHLIRLRSAQLAKAFSAEFEEMFSKNRFGADSPTNSSIQTFIFDGVKVEVLFSPDDRPERRLTELIDSAHQSVEMLAYSFTSDPIANALFAKANQGIRVRIVQDANQIANTGSDYNRLNQAGLDIRLDACAGLMHHKVLIIDQETVVLGSYNYTKSAETRNDENILIFHDPQLAAQFLEQFEALYAAAVAQ